MTTSIRQRTKLNTRFVIDVSGKFAGRVGAGGGIQRMCQTLGLDCSEFTSAGS